MKPAPLRYERARDVAQAVAMLRDEPDARLLAGGQSLMPMINLRVARPALLIDVNSIDALATVSMVAGRLSCGALVRHHDVAQHPEIRDWQPMLSHMAGTIGHYPIRRRGTLGGSLAHADPAAQYVLAAALLDPLIEARSSTRGVRHLNGREFVLAPYETRLETDEMIVSVQWPVMTLGEGWSVESLQQRQGEYMLASVACRVWLADQHRLAGAELAMASRGRLPRVQSVEDEAWLQNPDDERALQQVAESLAGPSVEGREDASAHYQAHLTRVLVRRALQMAVIRARDTLP